MQRRWQLVNVAMGFIWAGVCVPGTEASPYDILYDGNAFPENEDWTRITQGAVQRWLADGVLGIDTRADPMSLDGYRRVRAGAVDPSPGETFQASWRVRITGDPCQSIGFFSDDGWAVGFQLADGQLYSEFENWRSIPVPAGQFNLFELYSPDMRAYDLFLNGQLAMQGTLLHVSTQSTFIWGKGIQYGGSLAEWDFVRVGVVPEPSAALLLMAAIGGLWWARRVPAPDG